MPSYESLWRRCAFRYVFFCCVVIQSAKLWISLPSSLEYKTHLIWQLNCRSLTCCWSIACRRCSNYIFILDLIHGFNRLGKDNCKAGRESIKFWDLVRLILDTLRYLKIVDEIDLYIFHHNSSMSHIGYPRIDQWVKKSLNMTCMYKLDISLNSNIPFDHDRSSLMTTLVRLQWVENILCDAFVVFGVVIHHNI